MTTATKTYHGTAKTAPVDVNMTVGAVLRAAWGDYGYSYGLEATNRSGRYVFRCAHSDGSEWFLEADNYSNVYETENVNGRWNRGARV